jgi:hypothetical protein
LDRIAVTPKGWPTSHATGSKEVMTISTISTISTPLPRLASEAFYGWLGQWVKSLEPMTEADPVALLGLGLGALGHCVGETVLVQGQPVNQSMILVGNERAGGSIAWGHVGGLFSSWSQDWRKGLQPRLLPPRRDWRAWAEWWNRGKGSFLGWSRPEEVLDRLSHPEASYSGFASRTLLLRIRRGAPRPLADIEGVSLDAAFGLKESLDFAERLIPSRLSLSPEMAELWKEVYVELGAPRESGTMIDIMTELAERHVLRLAGLYALVDRSSEIKLDHLLAALAIWDHHEETLHELFAHQTGDKKSDLVLRYLREHSRATTNMIIRDVLKNNNAAGPILRKLKEEGLVDSEKKPGAGQPCWWFPTPEALNGVERRSYLGIAKAIMRKTVDPSPGGEPIPSLEGANLR